jgi:hypothetical protein
MRPGAGRPRPRNRELCLLAAALTVIALARSSAAQETHLLIVAGLGGEPAYAEAFEKWSSQLHSAAEKRMGIPRANIIYLAENPEKAPTQVDGRSTRDELEQAFRKMASQCRPGDTVAIILFGHGSGAGEEARFNLPGPDARAADFAAWLIPFDLQRVVFVNASSASGDFQKVLAGRNRVILTATKSSQERNESLFGGYFAAALSGDSADADKNGKVSIFEAFEAARAQVATEYERERRLLTEHAVLEDGAEGALARATFLGGGGAEAAERAEESADPVLAALERERRDLEDRIEALKATKESLPSERYDRELERLLLDLAMKSQEIRGKREAEKP